MMDRIVKKTIKKFAKNSSMSHATICKPLSRQRLFMESGNEVEGDA